MVDGVNSMMMVRLRERIPIRRLVFTYARSGGPGGQNVNKVNTRVTLWFDLDGDSYFDENQKRRLRSKLRSRINKEGYIHIVSMRHRTQKANRIAVIERFYELLVTALHQPKHRKPTKVSRAVKKRRLQQKKQRSQLKQLRSSRINRNDE